MAVSVTHIIIKSVDIGTLPFYGGLVRCTQYPKGSDKLLSLNYNASALNMCTMHGLQIADKAGFSEWSRSVDSNLFLIPDPL